MFGNIAAFVVSNDQMCAGLFGSDLGLRLDDERRDELRAHEGSGPFGPEGRPMRAYAVLPAAWRDDPAQIDEWVSAAIHHTATLPPKKKRSR
ncbi:MAG: TfoX/Sxy family protein [Myxococcales bacterium]|nr:TfoX/Sxy family protein [Myxococcales bacterium]